MRSTIKIDVRDLGDGKGLQPVISVKLEESEDVRDTLIQNFFQELGGLSSWLAVRFDPPTPQERTMDIKTITIYPVRSNDLVEVASDIKDRVNSVAGPCPSDNCNSTV